MANVENIGALKPAPLTLKLNCFLTWKINMPNKRTLLKEVDNATAFIVNKSFCLNTNAEIKLSRMFAIREIINELLTIFDFSFDSKTIEYNPISGEVIINKERKYTADAPAK